MTARTYDGAMAAVNVQPRAIASSQDGLWIAWCEAGRIVLVDATTRLQVAELAIELQPPVALALSTDPNRLVVVQTRGASTVVRVLSVPELEPVAEGTLASAARLVAVCGATAVLLGGADSLTTLDLATLHSTTLTVRGPIQTVAPFSDSQILVAARGKLETWSLDERRPTHRLGLALPRVPAFLGVAAGGTLLWAVSGEAPGTVTCYRLADGMLVGEVATGGRPIAVNASASQPVLVAVVQSPAGAAEVVAIELLAATRRVLPVAAPIAAACITSGDETAVIVLPERSAPLRVSLAGPEVARPLVLAPTETARPAPSAAIAPDEQLPASATHPVANRLDEWRAQVQAAVQVTATPSTSRIELGSRATGDEPRSRTRAELIAWGETVRSRRSTAPPPPPQVWRLTDLAHRFALDLRSRALLSLLYAAWLEGDGRTGVPVANVARALGNDELAWIDALAQGRLGKLGWIRARYGRVCLRPQIGHYLDEATPGVLLVAPAAGNTRASEPPTVASLWSATDDADLGGRLRELADACNVVVAAVALDTLPAARLERALDAKLLECRLHGALPVLHSVSGVPLDVAQLAEPMLLTCCGTAPLQWTHLPSWPPALTHEAAGS